MPFERLRAIVFADIRERGVSEELLERYSHAWLASAQPQTRAPMPCPACFARGDVAPLKGRSVADGYAAAVCSRCNITFQFSKGPKRPLAAAANAPIDAPDGSSFTPPTTPPPAPLPPFSGNEQSTGAP